MKTYKFGLNCGGGDIREEVIEFEDGITSAELEKELKEWVGNEIEYWIKEV